MATNEDIFGLIGAWAKEQHPEKYEQTLRVAPDPTVFRRYLLRLVELWVAEDRTRITKVPVSVLDETSITATVKILRGTAKERIVKFCGRRFNGVQEYRFAELLMLPEWFQHLQDWKDVLDLEYVRE